MRRPPVDPDTDPLALDDETVERLLAGDLPAAQAPPGYAEVARLLAAAKAAPSPQELAGQASALAALRAATRPAGGQRAARLGWRRRRRARRLTAVLAVALLAMGGAAAAATGNLPGPVRDATRRILVTVGATDATTPTAPGVRPASTSGAPGSGGSPDTQGPAPAGATARGPGATAAGPAGRPGVEGLCRAYLAGRGAGTVNKLAATAFEALAEAAGGADRIPAYCRRMQAGEADPKEQQQPPEDPGQGPATGGGTQGQGDPPGR